MLLWSWFVYHFIMLSISANWIKIALKYNKNLFSNESTPNSNRTADGPTRGNRPNNQISLIFCQWKMSCGSHDLSKYLQIHVPWTEASSDWNRKPECFSCIKAWLPSWTAKWSTGCRFFQGQWNWNN